MSQSHDYYHDGYASKGYQYQYQDQYQPTVGAMSSQEQTAGESQYQDPSHYQYQYHHYHPSNPISPPPISAPPPPPPSESDAGSIRSVGWQDDHTDDDGDDDDNNHHQISSSGVFPSSLSTPPSVTRIPATLPTTTHATVVSSSSSSSSYNYSSYQQTRAAPIPTITNYGVSPAQTIFPKETTAAATTSSSKPTRFVQGDTTIRPNTGQTNDEYGGIGSLREVTSRLRWMTIVCTLLALIWEGFAFPARLLIHTWDQPARVVLGGYLAFFCLLLLGVELNAPLRDLFGVLYHPLGRGFLLILMSSMCYGISIDWWELLLCVAFAGCSSGYIYAYTKYPEYRRWQDYNDNQIWSDMRHAVQQRAHLGREGPVQWADPTERSASRTWSETQRETQALLHQV